ncbi:MAG: hypothetical protein KC543_11875 [Myxococcales bacterium]|nr:hypothetical protein [Myxococcales bacterium]
MDRARLQRFVDAKHQTFRWHHPDEMHAYSAVETTDEGLLWYTWSNGGEQHGEGDRLLQSYADFASNGPARPLPEQTAAALRRAIAELGLAAPVGAAATRANR